jgi:hypothetical protein
MYSARQIVRKSSDRLLSWKYRYGIVIKQPSIPRLIPHEFFTRSFFFKSLKNKPEFA